MWRRADGYVNSKASESRTSFSGRYYSRTTPKREAVSSSLTLVPTYQSTRCQFPNYGNIHYYCCKKPQISQFYCKFSCILYGVVKSRKLRWTGHAARMGTSEMHTEVWWRNSKERIHFKDPDVDGRIILKLILNLWNGKAGTRLIWFIMRTSGRIMWTRQ